MSEATNERYTPGDVLQVVKTFGPIALDPCTTAANPVLAYRFFTAADDGLRADWHTGWSAGCADCDFAEGIAFVNPPYGRGHLLAWASAMKRWGTHESVELIGLVPADMSTAWMRLLLTSASCIAFWNKRIAFGTPDGAYAEGSKFGNAFVYYGERQGRFKRVFAPHSYVQVLR